jgi:acyl carrier protein phosphodiesterase
MELDAFCTGVYRHIAGRLSELPEHAHPAMHLMARENWLLSYNGLDGIADVLHRMSQRARRPNPLSGGEQAFVADSVGFAEDFAWWLADARKFAARWAELNGR